MRPDANSGRRMNHLVVFADLVENRATPLGPWSRVAAKAGGATTPRARWERPLSAGTHNAPAPVGGHQSANRSVTDRSRKKQEWSISDMSMKESNSVELPSSHSLNTVAREQGSDLH